jgi:hypothetical protein
MLLSARRRADSAFAYTRAYDVPMSAAGSRDAADAAGGQSAARNSTASRTAAATHCDAAYLGIKSGVTAALSSAVMSARSRAA